ncbi:MAG: YdiU family protein [Planctomycetes bacterium]|nr:YdiU family protein [Planctomycetota bacterium]
MRRCSVVTDAQPRGSSDTIGWNFDNTYARLPDVLFKKVMPAPVRAPRVSVLNLPLADELGLDLRTLSEQAAAALFAGQEIPDGAEPIAQAYAGHQYGGFTMLGDGRAILLGEQRTPDGHRFDIQLKGSGPTAFSRSGDGRAALGPMLREYIISEAMHALGIPTTRSLAVVTTGEPVYRGSPLRGAVLTRVAASHLRVGTFQYLAARRDEANLRILADYTIERHYPELVDVPQKYGKFLQAVANRQAALIAKWQLVGFIHGVMNTDNVAISGETIDYGPCAFMDAYHLETVFSSIDHAGRYAYGNQPNIAQWNLARFAETLLPLLDTNENAAVEIAMAELNQFPATFEAYWLAGMRKKLGFQTDEAEDAELIRSFLDWMQATQADFTNTFRDLSTNDGLTGDSYRDEAFRVWHTRWQNRLGREGGPNTSTYTLMRMVNPFVIPRNHRVEEALSAAVDRDDLSVMHQLLAALTSPYEGNADFTMYRDAPPPSQCGYRTYCGT